MDRGDDDDDGLSRLMEDKSEQMDRGHWNLYTRSQTIVDEGGFSPKNKSDLLLPGFNLKSNWFLNDWNLLRKLRNSQVSVKFIYGNLCKATDGSK